MCTSQNTRVPPCTAFILTTATAHMMTMTPAGTADGQGAPRALQEHIPLPVRGPEDRRTLSAVYRHGPYTAEVCVCGSQV